ncbi:MAG TPA: flagellar basal body rod protein FlgB [Clostridiales bacterium UBA8153]|nr:flagellar basal body rod protein FlgB [Clostridiales bacterium UBA8153]
MDRVSDLLVRGLTGAVRRHEAIAGNIANVNTPHYQRRDVDFLSVLRREFAARPGSARAERGRTARDGSSGPDWAGVTETFPMRVDGNTVDVEFEMNQLASNALYFNGLSRQLRSNFGRLRTAITEGRR